MMFSLPLASHMKCIVEVHAFAEVPISSVVGLGWVAIVGFKCVAAFGLLS